MNILKYLFFYFIIISGCAPSSGSNDRISADKKTIEFNKSDYLFNNTATNISDDLDYFKFTPVYKAKSNIKFSFIDVINYVDKRGENNVDSINKKYEIETNAGIIKRIYFFNKESPTPNFAVNLNFLNSKFMVLHSIDMSVSKGFNNGKFSKLNLDSRYPVYFMDMLGGIHADNKVKYLNLLKRHIDNIEKNKTDYHTGYDDMITVTRERFLSYWMDIYTFKKNNATMVTIYEDNS